MGMTINGWDISEANAKQRRLTIGHHSIKNISEWNQSSNRPEFLRSELGFKPITVDIMVKGENYAEIVANRGLIISKLTEVATVTFDRTPHFFEVLLDKEPTINEAVKDKWHIMTLELVGYEHGPEQIIDVSNSTGFDIDNIGNMDAPVTLYITPTPSTIIGEKTSESVYSFLDEDNSMLLDEDGVALVGYEEVYGGLKISGICYDPETGEPADILIKNYRTGATIKIDGETGVISENDVSKIEDVDIWSLPSIKPGLNHIKTNGEFMVISVHYKPRYI